VLVDQQGPHARFAPFPFQTLQRSLLQNICKTSSCKLKLSWLRLVLEARRCKILTGDFQSSGSFLFFLFPSFPFFFRVYPFRVRSSRVSRYEATYKSRDECLFVVVFAPDSTALEWFPLVCVCVCVGWVEVRVKYFFKSCSFNFPTTKTCFLHYFFSFMSLQKQTIKQND
jgi:hypothetical protein